MLKLDSVYPSHRLVLVSIREMGILVGESKGGKMNDRNVESGRSQRRWDEFSHPAYIAYVSHGGQGGINASFLSPHLLCFYALSCSSDLRSVT